MFTQSCKFRKNTFIIVAIVCLILLTISLILVHDQPAIGYESSIYDSTNILLWISLIFSISYGLSIILLGMFDETLEIDLWKIGLFIVYLCHTICISLFIIRGYFMWCMNGDPASHLGYINQTLLTGHVPSYLFYPILHIYASQVFLVSDINMIMLHKILPLIFGILYLLFFYILSKTVFSKKNQILLSAIAGSTFINGWYLNFTPNGLSNLYFPFLLYIILNTMYNRKVNWELLTLIMIFLYPIFHPVPTFVLILILSTLFLSNYVYNRKSFSNKTVYEKNSFSRFNVTLIILLFVWGITWISSFYVWESTIINIHTLMNEGGPTKISGLVENINYAKGYGYNVTEQVLKKIGGSLVYAIITVLSFPIIYKNRDKEKLNKLFSLYGPFWFISIFMLVLYFLNLNFGPLRVITYITIISTLFVGYILNYLIMKLRVEYTKNLALCFIGLIFMLLVIWVNGILTLYPSPYILETNHQTTMSEVEGMDWLFENKNIDLEITGFTISPYRSSKFLLTPGHKHKVYFSPPDYLRVPYHFGYDNNSKLSVHYNKSLYLGIDERDKRVFEDVFPEIAEIRRTPEDFEKLNWDFSIKKIYSSKKFEVFYIDCSGKV